MIYLLINVTRWLANASCRIYSNCPQQALWSSAASHDTHVSIADYASSLGELTFESEHYGSHDAIESPAATGSAGTFRMIIDSHGVDLADLGRHFTAMTWRDDARCPKTSTNPDQGRLAPDHHERNKSNASVSSYAPSAASDAERAGDADSRQRIRNQLLALRALTPAALRKVLLCAMAERSFGRGRKAAAYQIKGHDDLVLRVDKHLTGIPDQPQYIPITYTGPLEGLEHRSALGLPHAVVVERGRLQGKEAGISAHEAFNHPHEINMWVLNRCPGEQAAAGIFPAYLAMQESPRIAELAQQYRAATARVKQLDTILETRVDVLSRDIAQREVATIKRRLSTEMQSPTGIAYRALRTKFTDLTSASYETISMASHARDLCSAAHLLNDARDGKLRTMNGVPITLYAQRLFSTAQRDFVGVYTAHMQRVANLPDEAFDAAVQEIKRGLALAGAYHLNLNHGDNLIIDFDAGRFHFIDNDFTGFRRPATLDKFVAVLVGRHPDVRFPWLSVVHLEDLEPLRIHIKKIVMAVTVAARRHRVQWESPEAGFLGNLCRHFDIEIPHQKTA